MHQSNQHEITLLVIVVSNLMWRPRYELDKLLLPLAVFSPGRGVIGNTDQKKQDVLYFYEKAFPYVRF